LASYVEEKTQMYCKCLAEDEWLEVGATSFNGKQIVLWDCLNLDCQNLDERLTSLLSQFSDQCMVSLFNVDSSYKGNLNFISRWLYGVFYEDDAPEKIVKGIQAILQGQLWFSRGTMTRFILQNKNRMRCDVQPPHLTSREKEILIHLTSGAGNKEIAESLCVSQFTVKTHLYNIFKKIDVKTRGQASNWASRNKHFLMHKTDDMVSFLPTISPKTPNNHNAKSVRK
jgi:LuxR family transcriptional regulator of csgAB operon